MNVFKKYNFFIQNNTPYSTVSKLMNFMEDDGYGFLLLLSSKNYYKSPFRGSYTYNKEFKNIEEFKSIISDKSNFFKVNVILLDLMGMSTKEILLHKKELEQNISDDYMYFFMCDEKTKESIIDKETKLFKVDVQMSYNWFNSKDFTSVHNLIDVETKSKFTLDSFFKDYIRKRKINNVLNKRNPK